jgi:ATP-dependent helicase/DNAse subunit B
MADFLSVPRPLTESGFQLVLGPIDALEDAFLRKLANLRAISSLAPIDVLVGGVLQRPYLQRRAAETAGAIINVRFSTLGELGVRLGEAGLIAEGRRPITTIAERGFAGEIARSASGYFEPVSSTPGFADATRRLVRELRQEAIDPPDYARLVSSAAESKAKADALAGLYTSCTDRRAGRYDGEDALRAADPAQFDGIELLAYGIWRLGGNARHLIERLAARVPVVFFLPATDSDADAATAELISWLDAHGATQTVLSAAAPATALAHVQRELFAHKAPIAPDESVQLVSAPDPLTETREAARTCLDWARAGIPFRDMAVSYRDAGTYRPLVESIFAEAGIPLYLDDGPSVAERPLGRRLLALLDLVGTNLVRRDVMAFLTDGWLPTETRERYGNRPVSRWESASRRAGVVEGLEQWRDRLTAQIERERDDANREGAPEWLLDRVTDSETLLRFIQDFAKRLEALPESGTWRTCLDSLKPILFDYVQDVTDVVGHLDQLTQLDELLLEPVTFDRFRDTVRAEIEALKSSDLDVGRPGAFGLRGVNVLDVNQLRHLRFEAVALLGLTERSFPPPPQQDPLFLDGERERLNANGAFSLPLRARGSDPEPLQFALAVGAPRQRLLLATRRATEAGGRPQLPSSFFRLAASALAGRRLTSSEIESLAAGHYRRLRAGRIGAGNAARALTLAERDITILEETPELGVALLHRIAPATIRSDELRRARWNDRSLTAFDGLLSGDEALGAIDSWLDATAPLGARILENYASCPYKFFLDRLLRVKPIVDPAQVVELGPLDRGSAIHEIFQRFLLEHTPDDLRGKSRETLQHRLREIADEVLDEVEARGLGGAPMLWARSRNEIVDDLARWLDLEIAAPGDYPERGFEVAFGGRWAGSDESPYSRDEPLSLVINAKELRLRGRIDRIEWKAGDSFRIIDYKSGKNRQKGIFEGGEALQLAIYLLAASDIVGIDLEHGTAEYLFATRRGGFTTHDLTGPDLIASRAALETILGRIVGGVSGGDFHAEPGKQCEWCDFDPVCDGGRQRQAERKKEDERRVTFVAMREIE